MIKLMKTIVKDTLRSKTNKRTSFKIDQYLAARCPNLLAEQRAYVEREREGASWAHSFGLGLSPSDLESLLGRVDAPAPNESKRRQIRGARFGDPGDVRLCSEELEVG